MATKVLLPSDIREQDFWGIKPFSFAHAFVDLFFAVTQNSVSVQPEYMLKKWGWDVAQLQLFTSHPYVQKHLSIKIEGDFYIISRSKQTKVNLTKEEMVDDLAGRITVYFNEVFKTRYRNAAAWIRGLDYWAQYYSEDEIMEAIRIARTDDFWSDKMTPVILFRKKNPQGQDVDYVGQLLNKKTRTGNNIFDRMEG